MKKPIIIMIMLTVCVFGFVPLALTQDDQEKESDQESQEYEMVRGRIVFVDREKNEIVVRINGTDEIKVIRVKADIPKNVRVGKHVKIKLKKGTNQAEYVKKIRHAGE